MPENTENVYFVQLAGNWAAWSVEYGMSESFDYSVEYSVCPGRYVVVNETAYFHGPDGYVWSAPMCDELGWFDWEDVDNVYMSDLEVFGQVVPETLLSGTLLVCAALSTSDEKRAMSILSEIDLAYSNAEIAGVVWEEYGVSDLYEASGVSGMIQVSDLPDCFDRCGMLDKSKLHRMPDVVETSDLEKFMSEFTEWWDESN